jgi:hypothetical protein
MSDARAPYGNGNFPMLQEGDTLTAAHVRLIATAISQASSQRTNARSSGTNARSSDALAFACDESSCVCVGDDDCNDMFTGQSCGPEAVCLSDGAGSVVCICIPA